MVHWIPMKQLCGKIEPESTKQPHRLHIFNFFKESYRCIDILPEGIDRDIFESEIMKSHSADLLAVRIEYRNNDGSSQPPIYLGSNFHYSCGLELKSMTFINQEKHRQVALEFEKGYMNNYAKFDVKNAQLDVTMHHHSNWIWIYLPFTKKGDINMDMVLREEMKLEGGFGSVDREMVEVDGTSIVILQHGADSHDMHDKDLHHDSLSVGKRAYVVAGGHHMKGVVLKVALLSTDIKEGPDVEIFW